MFFLLRRWLVIPFSFLVVLSANAGTDTIVTAIVFSETIPQTMQDGQQWRFSNGDTYQGAWRNNRPHGQGRYLTLKGDEYAGTFHNGRFQGQGTFRFSNGDVYQGQWLDGQMHGRGEMKYQNGNVYSGEWAEGVRQGKGELVYRSGSFYKGNWLADEKSGKGYTQYRNGQRHVGEYSNNRPHGYGVQVESDGRTYRGTFSRGLRHGAGECNQEGGVVKVCLFDRGNEITDPAKLELAAKYLEKQQPVYDFNGGIAYHMEDMFTKGRYYVTSSQVWWERTEAMLADQLRIRSQDENQFIYLIINGYTGPGVYHLHKGDVIAASRSGEPIELGDDAIARVEIKTDENGEINGVFSISNLKDDSSNVRTYRIFDGRFQALNKPAEAAPGDNDVQNYLVRKSE
ncbi:MAG: hypothetical protein R3F38_17645 [Gammaproteobacteria bacterium]